MRKLDKEHLTKLALTVIGIVAFIYVPLWVSKISWLGINEPNQLLSWLLSVLTITFILIGIIMVVLLGFAVKYLFDWLFPKTETHKTYTPDKDGDE